MCYCFYIYCSSNRIKTGSDLLCNRSHRINAMLTLEEHSSNSDSHVDVVSTDLTMSDACSDESDVGNLDADNTGTPQMVNMESLTAKESIVDISNSTIAIEPIIIIKTCFANTCSSDSNAHGIITCPDQMENNINNITDASGLKDQTTKADEAVEGNLRHHSHFVVQEDTENSAGLPNKRLNKTKKLKYNISSANLGAFKHRDQCCKVLVAFGICCIVVLFLIPIIVFYVIQDNSNAEMDPEYSSNKNTSIVKVCCDLTKQIRSYLCSNLL